MALWTHGNIKAYIYLNDHCDPHVTFDCRADKWKARIRFNMVKPTIQLIDVKPTVNDPGLAVINELANQLHQGLHQCRLFWVQTKSGNCCLDNKDVERVSAGKVQLDGPSCTGRTVAGSAKYQKKARGKSYEVRASVKWNNGAVTHNELVVA